MDSRLIEKIEAYENGLNLVKEMKPVSYHYKGKPSKRIGLVAQEIQALEPMTVVQTNSGLVIDYDSLIPLLINAVKELSNQVDELKNNPKKKK